MKPVTIFSYVQNFLQILTFLEVILVLTVMTVKNFVTSFQQWRLTVQKYHFQDVGPLFSWGTPINFMLVRVEQ